MIAIPKTQATPVDYLALDRQSDQKYEYVGGRIVAVAGASRKHNLITFNLAGLLGQQLKGRVCEGYSGDMRVHVPITGDYTYPDIVVVCGQPELLPDTDLDTLINPTAIIEVTSPATADYDRGSKFESYRQIASLREYVIIAQETCHAVCYVRQTAHTWLLSETRDLADTLYLPSIACRLPLAELYDRVVYDPGRAV
jgi:Uma2 family endonuclease